jgi:TRAP-type C4-dicarboxylate transport system substrate-binding protein
MAAIAPEGSSWARECRTASRDIAAATNGAVEVKWYLGGIAGDEQAALERVRRGLLDGIAGASACVQLAPSLRALEAVGLIQTRDEARTVLSRLRPTVDREFSERGFAELGLGTFGVAVIFSRTPVQSMDDLRQRPMFIWRFDDTFVAFARHMGIRVVPLDLSEGGRAYDEGKIDGFFTVPTAALAFQWLSQVRYFTPLPGAIIPACVAVSQRALDALSTEQQAIVRHAMVRSVIRNDEIGSQLDDELLGELLQKQGVHRVPVSRSFRSEFLMQAVDAREQGRILPELLINQVATWLADRRAQAPAHAPHDQP